jgi:hypothetical protein
MKIRLSSRLTLFYKIVFPSVMTVGAIQLVRVAFRMTDQWLPMMIFLALAGLLTFFPWRWMGGFKNVRIEGNALVIGNFIRTIRVPLSQVGAVIDRPYINPTSIISRQRTEFGDRIAFMGLVWLIPFESHPNIRRLKIACQTGSAMI